MKIPPNMHCIYIPISYVFGDMNICMFLHDV